MANFKQLRDLWGDAFSCPFMPVLQGWNRDEYLRCLDLYAAHGVDLTEYPVIGLGSVCRRQATGEIGAVVAALRVVDPAMALHGFGVKKTGLAAYGHMLTADTNAEFNRAAPTAWPGHSMPGGMAAAAATAPDTKTARTACPTP